MTNILIIKPDHIGDYILFRNFIQEIKNIEKYKHCNIICVFNTRIKEMAEFLDKDTIDNFIFIDLKEYILGEWYYKRKNQEITQLKYSLVINALYNKFLKFEELISNIDCKKKYVLYESVYDKNKQYKNNHGLKYYKMIDVSSKKEFIYEGTKKFFKKIFNSEMKNIYPQISLKNDERYNFNTTDNFITIFIGADDAYRKWSIYNYITVIKYILGATNLNIVLCGSEQEYLDSIKIEEEISNSRLYNLTSKTSLIDMLYIVKDSKFVLSNETGIVHMAIALNVYVLVISNANHFGKFTPYPKNYTKKYIVIYPFNIKKKNDYDKYLEKYYASSNLDINTISTNKVIQKLILLFNTIQIPLKEYLHVSNEERNNNLSASQINLNYTFSTIFSKLYDDILKLKNTQLKFLVYGNGSFGNILVELLKSSCIGIIDKNIINSFNNLNKEYDKIIISVLGREDIIENDLIKLYNIPKENIITFKIVNDKYNVRPK